MWGKAPSGMFLLLRGFSARVAPEMNASAANASVVVQVRDSFGKAVTKSVIVLLLGISINYINRGLIRTFCKHQVPPPPPGPSL